LINTDTKTANKLKFFTKSVLRSIKIPAI